LSLDGQILLIILLLVFKFKDLLTQLLYFLGQGSDFQLEFSFLLVVVSHCFNFLLFQLLNKLLFFFILLLGLLSQMLDLLLEQGPLLVVFGVTSFLKSGDFLLLLEGGVHALGDFLLFAGHVLAQLVQLVF